MAAAGALDVVSRLTTCAASTLHDLVSATFPDRLRRASAETNRLYAMSESWDSGARRSVLQQKCWPIEDFFWEGAINRAW